MHAMLRNFVLSVGGFGAQEARLLRDTRKVHPVTKGFTAYLKKPKGGSTAKAHPSTVSLALIAGTMYLRGARCCPYEEAQGPTQPTKLGVDATRDVLFFHKHTPT